MTEEEYINDRLKEGDFFMNFPVLVEVHKDKFEASLVGIPNLRVVESTRSQAISSIESMIQKRIEQGELVSLEIDTKGVSSLAGKYKSDPTLRDISDNAYAMRDSESSS